MNVTPILYKINKTLRGPKNIPAVFTGGYLENNFRIPT